MPNPHFDITITQRSKGQSAVAGAAYQSGEKLFSEYDQKTKNYTGKRGILYTEIMLPSHAPPEYANRETLWNSVEAAEKQWNAQLARRFVLALPKEVPPEQYPQMVRDYCEKQFVSKGMIADFAIHDPAPPGHNVHCHVMLIVQDAVWGRVTANRSAGKSTRYYADEFHLLLKEEQTAAYSVEIWKRFRKWGGIPTALTQNVKDLLASPEVSNIFENSDFVYMLNQANGDRQILAKQLNISPHQLSYVTHSGEGEGLLFFGNVILPFVDHFPKDLELYRILTTRLSEVAEAQKHE